MRIDELQKFLMLLRVSTGLNQSLNQSCSWCVDVRGYTDITTWWQWRAVFVAGVHDFSPPVIRIMFASQETKKLTSV